MFQRFSRLNARHILGSLLAAAIVFAGLKVPGLFTPDNVAQVLRQSAVLGIITIGVTFVLIVGRLDLSVGSLLSLCAVVCITLHDSVSPGVAIMASLLIGIAVGCANGFLVAVLKLNSLIATLGMLSVLQGIALIYTSGQNVLVAHPDDTWFAVIGRGYLFGVPLPLIILIVLAITASAVLRGTTFGQQIFAVGGNEIASVYSSINARATIFIAYVIAGAMTGLAAIVFGSRVMAAQNDSGSGYELQVLAGIVLGGTSLLGGAGGVGRSLFGIVILSFIQNALLLLGMPYYFQWIITWGVILIAVWADMASKRGGVLAA